MAKPLNSIKKKKDRPTGVVAFASTITRKDLYIQKEKEKGLLMKAGCLKC
ncbi:hypothetical protein [Falsibacillus albus]|nr:hypothetical protein [Falsibacillus albus]